jgi:hypothetical protein
MPILRGGAGNWISTTESPFVNKSVMSMIDFFISLSPFLEICAVSA